MQTNISQLEPLLEIEQALKSDGIIHAAELLQEYMRRGDHSSGDKDRLLNVQLTIFINQGRFDELEQLVQQSESGDLLVQAKLSVAKGILSNRQGDFRKSLTCFLEAESLARHMDNETLWAQIQINIGTAFAGLHYYKEGLSRYNVVLDKHSDVVATRTRAALHHNLGNLYYAFGEIDQSVASLTKAISCAEDIEQDDLLSKSQLLLVRAKLKLDQRPQMNDIAFEESSDLYPVFRFCQVQTGDREERTLELGKVIAIAQSRNDFLTQIESLQLLFKLQQVDGNLEGAIETLKNLRSVEAALRTVQEEARLVEQAAKFDIAEKEQAIKALEKEKELQQEIFKRNEMLEVANEDLRQFAYVVSHDLKEPLRMIGSYTQLIELETKALLKGQNAEYFEYVSGGVERLNVLLDGLSSYSTLKSLQESKEKIALSSIVDTAIDNLDFLIHESKAEINFDEDVEIYGSKALLILLFQNLLQNAIKFSKTDSIPLIHIKTSQSKNGLVIDISDNGIGMAHDQQERIFIIFQRLSRADKHGSGMGLAICKKIVQLHEGKIFVQSSEEGKGTTFRIDLPN